MLATLTEDVVGIWSALALRRRLEATVLSQGDPQHGAPENAKGRQLSPGLECDVSLLRCALRSFENMWSRLEAPMKQPKGQIAAR